MMEDHPFQLLKMNFSTSFLLKVSHILKKLKMDNQPGMRGKTLKYKLTFPRNDVLGTEFMNGRTWGIRSDGGTKAYDGMGVSPTP